MSDPDFFSNDDWRPLDSPDLTALRKERGPDLRTVRDEHARSLTGKKDTPLLCPDCGEGLPFHRSRCAHGALS
jgi:hypothetical protein